MAMTTGWRSCSTIQVRHSFKWQSRIKLNLVMEQKLVVVVKFVERLILCFILRCNRSYDSPGQAETIWQTIVGNALFKH